MAMNSGIYTNMDSVRNYNIFNTNKNNASNSMTRATSGLRIASVQDGPADWAISTRMRERINSLNQANQNTQNDNSMMKITENGISNIVSILQTLKEKAIKAADAHTSEDDRNALQKETDQLLSQIDDIAYSTKYNGTYLLAMQDTKAIESATDYTVNDATSDDTDTESVLGYHNTNTVFQVGDDANIKINVNLPNMTLKGLGLVNPNLIKETLLAEAEEGMDAAITEAVAAANELATEAEVDSDSYGERDANYRLATNQIIKLDKREYALTAVKAIDRALNTAIEANTEIGAIENRLGYTEDGLTTQIENLQASDSTIRDANMAKEISEYMKWNVLSQASQYMLAQSNQNAFSVLNLLQ